MESGRRRFTAVIGEPDDLRRSALRARAEASGFRIEGEESNPVAVLEQAEVVTPSLLLTGYAYWGMSGLELAERALQGERPPVVVLVLDDLALRDRALEAGCFAVVPEGDGDALGRVLDEVSTFLLTGERRAGGDRRSGQDRRTHQDWSKVTHERRSGRDRRAEERRTEGDEPAERTD